MKGRETLMRSHLKANGKAEGVGLSSSRRGHRRQPQRLCNGGIGQYHRFSNDFVCCPRC